MLSTDESTSPTKRPSPSRPAEATAIALRAFETSTPNESLCRLLHGLPSCAEDRLGLPSDPRSHSVGRATLVAVGTYGLASEPVTSKFIARSDAAAQWIGTHKGHPFFAYTTHYLIE